MMENIKAKAAKIKLLLTDCDGVLTDGGVFYGENGEALKKFNVRDGMGSERLLALAGVETGIITGENSLAVKTRAKKLKINELHLGIKDKPAVLREILHRRNLQADQIAYIGDDTNDVEMLQLVGLAACPADGLVFAKNVADYICDAKGGEGCFREFCELIISSQV